jgi:RHS repeat-associated protein
VRPQHDPWGLELPVGVKGDNRFLFTGKETQETGYIDFGARQYDNLVPRFLGIDPLAENGSHWSPYVYGFNNPLKFIDPDGMWPELPASVMNSLRKFKEEAGKVFSGSLNVEAKYMGVGAGVKVAGVKLKAEANIAVGIAEIDNKSVAQ